MVEPDHKRCLGCGYILDGLAEPRCPECGRGFDPADPDSYAIPPDVFSGQTCLVVALVALSVLLVSIGASLTLAKFVALNTVSVLLALPGLASFPAAGAVIFDAARALRWETDTAARRRYALALVIGILTILAFLAVGLGVPMIGPVRSMR